MKKTKGSKPVQYDKRTMARTDSTKDNPRTTYSKKTGRTIKKELRVKYNEAVEYTGPKKGELKGYGSKAFKDYEKNMDPKKRQALKDKATKGMKFTHEGKSYGIFKGDGMSFPERMKAKAKKEKEKKKKLVKAEDYFVGTVRDTRWNSDHLDEVLGYAAQIAGGMVRDGVRGLDNPDIKPGKDTVKKLKTQAAEKKQTVVQVL